VAVEIICVPDVIELKLPLVPVLKAVPTPPPPPDPTEIV
jgi:hypothetical protein